MRRAMARQAWVVASLLLAGGALGLSSLAWEIEVPVSAPTGSEVTVRAVAPVPQAIGMLRTLRETDRSVFAESRVAGGVSVARLGIQGSLRVRLTASGPGLVPMEIPAVAEDPPEALTMKASVALDLGVLETLAPATKVFVRLRPSAPPADCRPVWRSAEHSLEVTREELARLGALADDLVAAFVPELGELSLRPAEKERRPPAPPVRRLVRFRRLLPASGEPVVLLFGRHEIAIAVFDARGEAVVAAPPGEWRLRARTHRGSGTWSGEVRGASEEAIEIAEEEPVRLRVQAVDAQGEAIAPFDAWPFLEASRSARRGPPGRWVSVELPSRSEPTLFCISAPGFETGSRLLRSADAATVVRVSLPERAEHARARSVNRYLTGRVVAEDGAPLVGVRVAAVASGMGTLQVLSGRQHESARPDAIEVDQAGEFRLGPLRGEGAFDLVVLGDGVAASRARSFTLAASDPAEVDLGVVEVRSARQVGGRVVDASTSVPLSGAEVMVFLLRENAMVGAKGSETKTGDDGRFAIANLPSGERLRVVVRASSYVLDAVALADEASAEDRRLELRLERGATVRGRTIAADGAPVAAVEVTPNLGSPPRVLKDGLRWSDRVGTTSGPDGRFELSGIPCVSAPTVALTAWARGFVARNLDVPISCGATSPPIDIVLARSIPWRGRVLRQSTGQPVGGALVTIRGSGKRTAPDGSFVLDLSGLGEFEGRVELADGLEIPFVISVTEPEGLVRDLIVP